MFGANYLGSFYLGQINFRGAPEQFAKTKSLQYTILLTHSIQKSLRYAIRQTLPIQKSLKYHILYYTYKYIKVSH